MFPMEKSRWEIVGSDKRGTGKTPFRGIDKGSDIKHAFNFSTTEKPKDIYIFEAPIDALSYRTLNQDKDGIYMSMNGLKQDAVRYQIAFYMKRYETDPESVHLCVDNDEAGNKFINNFKGLFLINQVKK